MDLSVILGLLSGIGLIFYGITGSGSLSNFYDFSSIMITFGGTIAATVMSFPPAAFKSIPKHLKIIFSRGKNNNPVECIEKIVEYAQEARKKGLLALERQAEDEKDPFLKSCILLIVDAIEPTKAREILENELDCIEERHAKGWSLYEKAATYAPAYGMIGTLIGLINMLKNLGDINSGDVASGLGAGMSVALVTTFYGSMFANLVLMPIAIRLRACHDDEMVCKQIIVDGVLSIHAGTNPRHIEERLKAYIANLELEKRSKKKDKKSK